MWTRSFLALTALGLASCHTPCPPTEASSFTVSYSCADGSDLQVTFSRGPDAALVLQEGYTSVSLPLRSTAVGFRYAGDGLELQGRRSEVHWSRPGAAETVCREHAAD